MAGVALGLAGGVFADDGGRHQQGLFDLRLKDELWIFDPGVLHQVLPVGVVVHHDRHRLKQRGQALIPGNDLVQSVQKLHVGLALHHAVVLAFDVATAKIGRHLQNILECLHLAGGQPGRERVAVNVAQQRRRDFFLRRGILRHQLVDRLGVCLHKVGGLDDVRRLGCAVVVLHLLRHTSGDVDTIIFQVLQNCAGQVGQGSALGACHRDDLGGVAGGDTLEPAAQTAAVVNDVVHRLEERRVAAVDHLVIAARCAGHFYHSIDDRAHGVHLVRRQLADQLVGLCLDLQLLAQQFRRSTVGIGDRRLGHRDILERQHVRVVIQRAGLGQSQLAFLAADPVGHGFCDLIQLVIGDLLVHRLNGDSNRNDALTIFFVDLIVKIDVGVAVDLALGLVQHGAAHVGPVGRIAVHLLFQRLNVPDQRFALLFFGDVQVLVALAQLINFQTILALHRERIGDIHRCVELF